MRILDFLTLLHPFLSLCAAYDNFQGLGVLTRPCFPAYDHKECNKTLLESYDPPYKGPPQNPATTQFFLFTQASKDKAEKLHQCGGGLPPQSTFDTTCPTEIFIHGWSDGVCRTAWMREMKEQLYLKNSCYNVILVDWSWGNFPDFAAGAQNARVVGQQTAFVLKNIAQKTQYDYRKFHIIGHSFGAIAGSYAGKRVQLGRLTALDPALAPLLNASEEERLNRNDALFVDVISTNGGYCFPFNHGDPRPMGHVNFYVNDGIHQFSCYPYAFESLLKLDVLYAIASIFYPALCYHLQAIQYYKVSILADTDDTQLIGVQCNSRDEWLNGECERNCEEEGNCLPMGMDTSLYVDYRNTDLSKRKIFYVPTTLTCPYSDHSGFTGLPLKRVDDQ